MKTHSWSVICAASAVLFSVLLGSADAAHVQDEVLVKYKAGRKMQAQAKASAMSAKVVQNIDQIGYQRLKLPKGLSVEQAIERLKKDPNVEYVGPNHIIRVCREPNDEIYQYGLFDFFTQWWLNDVDYPGAGIDAVDAWDITTGSPDIIIAVVDTGVTSSHEDLYAKIIPGRNVLAGADPNNTEDDYGHGTEVAGVAAAMTDNGIGMAGVCWGAKIMPIKILDASGAGLDSDGAAGVVWAADHGAKIINMSWGGYDFDQSLKDAIQYAWNKGCVLVGGSGNDDRSDNFYPAVYDQVLAVGASNELMSRCTSSDWGAGGSNYGSHLDVVAPGSNILSTANEDSGLWGPYMPMLNGTSFATPIVSGVAALLWSQYPTWTNAQIVAQIKMTAKDVDAPGWDQYTGFGIVSAHRALTITPENAKTIGQLSGIASGKTVSVTQAIITSGTNDLSDRLYIEQPDRACGIMLPFATKPAGLVEGDRVEVMGTLATVKGERAIQNATVNKISAGDPVKPIAMSTKSVGGTRLAVRSGITNGKGTNNVGMLVTVYGKVTSVGWTYFYIDDGCKLQDGSGLRGLKIVWDSADKPKVGDYVRVTGISSIEQPVAGVSIPVIRVRKSGDWVVAAAGVR